jgi:hypothetical protein
MQHITLKMEVETPPLGFTDPNSSTRMDIDTDEAAIEFRMRNMTPEQQEELLIEVLKHRDTPRTREILKYEFWSDLDLWSIIGASLKSMKRRVKNPVKHLEPQSWQNFLSQRSLKRRIHC